MCALYRLTQRRIRPIESRKGSEQGSESWRGGNIMQATSCRMHYSTTCGEAELCFVVGWVSCVLIRFTMICQNFTGMLPEFHKNVELEQIKKENNHNSAFPHGRYRTAFSSTLPHTLNRSPLSTARAWPTSGTRQLSSPTRGVCSSRCQGLILIKSNINM